METLQEQSETSLGAQRLEPGAWGPVGDEARGPGLTRSPVSPGRS